MNSESFKKLHNYDTASQVMRQYLDIKFTHFECLVLFRMGDFYELFYNDAITASKILGIALTKRGKSGDQEIPMCGVPFHALDNYLNKLIEDGYKIAICDQLESPEEAKKHRGYKAVVNRDVVRIITPGTVIEESLVKANLPNYLASIVLTKTNLSIAFVDIGTGEFNILEISIDNAIEQLIILQPREILLSENLRANPFVSNISSAINTKFSYQVESFFALNKAEKIILAYYKILSLQPLGNLSNIQISALGSILEYINLTQKASCPQLDFPKLINLKNFMQIDSSTRTNLEITESNLRKREGSLLSVIDQTQTKSGARLLYTILSNPLIDISEINWRLNLCEFFVTNNILTEKIIELLPKIGDLDRIIIRLQTNRANARDLLAIRYTLETSLKIKRLLINEFGLNTPAPIQSLSRTLSGDEELLSLIVESIKEDVPLNLNEGNFIKPEYHAKVKELYSHLENNKENIENLKRLYQNETGIDSLKIQHNNVIGLFIDITPKAVSKLKHNNKFIHRQTTITSVRYTTLELQALESEIVNSKTQVISLEQELFSQICHEILRKSALLKDLASCLSLIDVFSSLGCTAKANNFCRPEINDSNNFEIKMGRHPVIESLLRKNHKTFVANDCSLSLGERLWLITGPNMSGKSTFLKQNAIIAILAQIGSFVPATFAKIGIIDKIYSRIGASDNLLKGESTFMVEMLETSAILSQATSNSLIILDEVGRGTSTYDGVSIAWAVLEHIHDKLRCRCIFATHYFELINLSEFLPSLKNYTVAIEESEDKILFLHKIISGSANKSYGIHVAKLAGLPKSVINRANEILDKLEKNSNSSGKKIAKTQSPNMSLFTIVD